MTSPSLQSLPRLVLNQIYKESGFEPSFGQVCHKLSNRVKAEQSKLFEAAIAQLYPEFLSNQSLLTQRLQTEFGIEPTDSAALKVTKMFSLIACRMGKRPQELMTHADQSILQYLREQELKNDILNFWEHLPKGENGIVDRYGEEVDLDKLTLSQLSEDLSSWINEHPEVRSLEMLDLKFCELNNLPPQIGLFSNLKVLNVSHNALRKLPPEIGQLSKLKKVFLIGNKLTTLPVEMSKLSSLQEIYIR